MKAYQKVIVAVVAGMACGIVSSHAAVPTLINPSSTVAIDTSSQYSLSGGAVSVVAPLISNYNFGGVDIGTLTTSVYKNDANNPLGGLTFVYTIAASVGDVTGLTVDGFIGTVYVSNLLGSNANATQATYNPFGGINFSWGGAFETAPTTLSVVVDTGSTSFVPNIGNIQDNQAGNAPIYAPVPEPTTIAAGALMLLPFAIGAIRSLRKEQVS